jgi:hypothetical protein
MEDNASAKKSSAASKWATRLRGRSRMAVAAVGGVFLVGFLGIARPLSQRIDGADERLAKATVRAQLASEVADLRHQASLYQKKLPRGVDPNDWTNYLLEGIRGERVKLVRLEPKEILSLGPCKVLAWQVELEGSFESLGRVVEWLENGRRLVRIDRCILQSGAGGSVGMTLLVKGLALDVAPDKLKAEKEKAEKAEKARVAAAKRAEQSKLPTAIEDAMPRLPENLKLPLGIQLPDPAKVTHSDALRKAIEEGQEGRQP